MKFTTINSALLVPIGAIQLHNPDYEHMTKDEIIRKSAIKEQYVPYGYNHFYFRRETATIYATRQPIKKVYCVNYWNVYNELSSQIVSAANIKEAVEKVADGHPYVKTSDRPDRNRPFGTLYVANSFSIN